jgi:hypothetical protein
VTRITTLLSFVLLSISLALTLGCAGGRPAGSATDRTRIGAAAAEDRACSRDSECALVDDCCGCSLGGQRLAVRSERVETLAAGGDAACSARHCAPVPTPHRSCDATAARCLGGLCVPAL